MRHPFACLALAGACAVPVAAAPLEPMAPFDAFSNPTLQADRWGEFERVRRTRNSSLNLVQRDVGTATSDTGATALNFNTLIANPGRISQLRAKVRVDAVAATGCAANATPTQVRARLVATLFNTGNPVTGSFVGDVIAQVFVRRLSNAGGTGNELEAGAAVSVCQNADCSVSLPLGAFVPLGTVFVGQEVTLQMEWDRVTRQISFARSGGGSASGSVTYTQSDSAAPGSPFKQIGTRVEPANCQSGPRTSGFIDASFDLVETNRSAAR